MSEETSVKIPKEFDPDYKPTFERPNYSWKTSVRDWYRQSWAGSISDKQAEDGLLSLLPFYPNADKTRIAKVIDTKIDETGNYIHEFYIENTEKSKKPLDVVLIHGYAASLGLFIDNFNDISLIPGIKIHAIDLLGFGLSSRPDFPNYKSDTKEDILKSEDWFIDSLEQWRIKRGINQFVLMGHSFGGYLSSAYALKYNKKVEKSANNEFGSDNLIEKLVLISPVGVERNKYSLLKDTDQSHVVSPEQQRQENSRDPDIDVDKEFTQDQDGYIHDDFNSTGIIHDNDYEPVTANTKKSKLIKNLWGKNVSPFSIIRNVGPIKSKLISNWTTMRFAHVYAQDPQKFQKVHDYIYRIFNGKGSGEYALTRVLAFGAVAKLPLIDRCPKPFVQMNLPTLWLYGDRDWMSESAGLQMTKEINKLASKKLADYKIVPNAGHHLYLDNPAGFKSEIFKFLASDK